MLDVTPVAAWALKNPDKVEKYVGGIRSWWKRRTKPGVKGGILVVGAGGAGKSTLGKVISGSFNLLTDPTHRYNENIGTEILAHKHEPARRVVIPPGQKHRRDAEWTQPLREVAAGNYRGVVIVAAYGYHSLGQIDLHHHPLWNGDKARFVANYTAASRQDELGVLDRLRPSIESNTSPMWILTAVTKEDLWAQQERDVRAFYTTGPYAVLLAQIAQSKDQRQFRREVVLTSLTINNFTTSMGEQLQLTTAGSGDKPCALGSFSFFDLR